MHRAWLTALSQHWHSHTNIQTKTLTVYRSFHTSARVKACRQSVFVLVSKLHVTFQTMMPGRSSFSCCSLLLVYFFHPHSSFLRNKGHSINFHSSPVPWQCHPSKEPQTDKRTQKKGAIIDLMSASVRAKRAERQHKAIQDREEREWSALSWYHTGKLSGNAQKFQNLSSIDFVLLDNSAILSASSWLPKLKNPTVCVHEHPVHICQCFRCLFVNVQTSH